MNVPELVSMKIADIKLAKYNPRKITKEDFDQLKKNLEHFGLVEHGIVWNKRTETLVGGHQRIKALKELGVKDVLVSVVDVSQVEEKALNVSLNQLRGDWNFDKLKDVLLDLKKNDYDLNLTGFDGDDLKDCFDEGFAQELGALPVVREEDYEVPVEEHVRKIQTGIKQGDVFVLGDHRLLCGDTTKEEDVSKLMDGEKADMVFTDPPYGVEYSEKNEFLNKIDKGACVQKHIEQDDIKDMDLFLTSTLESFKPHLKETNTIYITFAGSTLRYLLNSLDKTGFKLHQILVWAKNNHVLGRVDYASKHELIVYGWYGKHKYYGDFCPSVWNIDKPTKSDLHPTMKPVELCAKAIKNGTEENMIVLDMFGGSGSTLIACEQTKRYCRMMEIDPQYCQVIINRWEDYTGKKAEKVMK